MKINEKKSPEIDFEEFKSLFSFDCFDVIQIIFFIYLIIFRKMIIDIYLIEKDTQNMIFNIFLIKM